MSKKLSGHDLGRALIGVAEVLDDLRRQHKINPDSVNPLAIASYERTLDKLEWHTRTGKYTGRARRAYYARW